MLVRAQRCAGWMDAHAGRITGARPPGARELAIAAGAIVLGVLAMYLPYSFDGGMYTDDYSWAARAEFAPLSLSESLVALSKGGLRPFHGVGTLLQAQVFGVDGPVMFIPSMICLALQCFAFFWLLRLLTLNRVAAAAATALLLTVPWVDATRLWFTMAHESFAVAVWLLGVCLSIVGIRSARWWRFGALAASVVLYAVSVLTYEGTLFAIVASGGLYLVASPRRAALTKWGADIALGLIGGLLYASTLQARGAEADAGQSADRLQQLFTAWKTLVRFSLPADSLLWGGAGALLAALAAFGLGRATQIGGEERGRVVRALKVTAASLVFVAASLAHLAAASSRYTPSFEGTENRYAVVTAPPTIVLLVGGVWLLALGLAAAIRRPSLAMPAAVALVAAFLAGFVHQERQNQTAWIAASREQATVVAGVERAFGGRPPRGAGIFTLRHRGFTNSHVPVFITPYDLWGRLLLRYNDRLLSAHPYQAQPIVCSGAQILFLEWPRPSVGTTSIPFSQRTFAVDIPTGTAMAVPDQKACIRLRDTLLGAPDRIGRKPWRRLGGSRGGS